MDGVNEWVRQYVGIGATVQARIVVSLIAIFGLALLYLLAIYLVSRRTSDTRVRYRWRKTSSYLTVLLGLLIVTWIWWDQVQGLATFLGLISASLVIALGGPLTNLAGWAFIVWRRPFVMGDRLEIGGHIGDVIDVRIFQFSMLEVGNWVDADQSTGRVIHVPNGKVFSDPLINYSKGFPYIWNEVPVRITFESNWEKTKALLLEIGERHAVHLDEDAQARLRQAANRFTIVYSVLTPTVYTRVETHGVLLTIRYLCEVRRRRSTEAAIWEDVLRAFARHADVEFAYPTQRFYSRRLEGPTRVRAGDTDPASMIQDALGPSRGPDSQA